MNVGRSPSQPKDANKISILLIDSNSERRALRTKVMALHGIKVVGAGDLTEATSVWNRDRYNLVLIDIRRDYRGCLAWRDEIKKESPQQVVAFLIGGPDYIDLAPREDSYVAEKPGLEWGDSLRLAVRQSCESLPQRNSLAEAILRITAAKNTSGADTASTAHKSSGTPGDILRDATPKPVVPSRLREAETRLALPDEEQRLAFCTTERESK